MFFISLASQVEYIVENMAQLKTETALGFKRTRIMGDYLEENMKKIEAKVDDTKVALAKTLGFDNKIQNDSQAVLTRVSQKCDDIGNVVSQKVTYIE